MTRARRRRRPATSATPTGSAARRRRRRISGAALWLVGGALVVLAGLAGALAWVFWPGDQPAVAKAAIVDQLALTDVNPSFVQDATRELQAAGYTVDYYPPAVVTVDFYRDLPKRGYKIIVLRSHASDNRERVDGASGAIITDHQVGLFTNEPYSTGSHVQEQYAYQLGVGSYPQIADGREYFSIVPEFVSARMRGRFDGTLVVLMGCAGLKTDGLAKTFIDRGASAFVSWDLPVTAAHTDRATASFLRHLTSDRLDARAAVARTMADVGPDPDFGATLLSYP